MTELVIKGVSEFAVSGGHSLILRFCNARSLNST